MLKNEKTTKKEILTMFPQSPLYLYFSATPLYFLAEKKTFLRFKLHASFHCQYIHRLAIVNIFRFKISEVTCLIFDFHLI